MLLGICLVILVGCGGHSTGKPTATFQDYFNYANGTQINGQVSATGQKWGVTGYNPQSAQVWSKKLVFYPESKKPSGPWYAFVDTGSSVRSYSATFTLAANGGAGDCNIAAMIIYADPNNITNRMIHTQVNCAGVVLTWWDEKSQEQFPQFSSSASGNWVSNMKMTAGNTYTVKLSWDGSEWVHFTGPDGGTLSFHDPHFASVGGSGIIWEEGSDPTDTLYCELSAITTTD